MKNVFKNRKIGVAGGILVLSISVSFLCYALYVHRDGRCFTKNEIEKSNQTDSDDSNEITKDISPEVIVQKEGASEEDFYAEGNNLKNKIDENESDYEKGYNLPVEDLVMEEAEADCRQVMELIQEIYINADKGNSKNVVISDEAAVQMLDIIEKTGCPVTAGQLNFDMHNYLVMEAFLVKAENDEACEQTTYEILTGGGIHRKKYCFDGTDMYVLGTIATWNTKNEPVINTTTCYRLKDWEYTQKGWFIFEYCVPEPPAVSERINGTVMIRVMPLGKKYREIAEVYLAPIGYQGNNLFCSDWNVELLQDLDYNGLFQYLYTIEYGEYMDRYVTGIPKEEFENMMTKYLPVTREQLQQYASYDTESQTYRWQILGCGNYTPSLFGTSVPEITNMVENADGTTTLTIDAVCEMLGSDKVITHVLTVQFEENGNIVFLGNRVLDDGLQKIPTYEYRFDRN